MFRSAARLICKNSIARSKLHFDSIKYLNSQGFHSSSCLSKDKKDKPDDLQEPENDKMKEKDEPVEKISELDIVDLEQTEASKPAEKTSSTRNGRQLKKNSAIQKSFAQSVPEKILVPKDYPQLLAIPVSKRCLFPGFYKSMYIKDPQVILAIQNLMERKQPYLGLFLSKKDDIDHDCIEDIKDVHKVGVFAQIINVYQAGPDNSALTVVVYPHRRIRINSLILPKAETTETTENLNPVNKHLKELKVSVANVSNLKDQPSNSENPVMKALTSEILNCLKKLTQNNQLLRDQILTFSIQTGGNAFQDPAKLADFVATVCLGDSKELQEILESLVIEERLQKALILVKKEIANVKLQEEIAKKVDKNINRKQQEYYLMEQLKGIKKELGIEADGKEKLIETFKKKANESKMSAAIRKVFDEEILKLNGMDPTSSEFNLIRNYVDWLVQLPWGIHSNENFDIINAIKVLDEDHYGLKDVKDRILEFISVGKLKGSVEGKIICLAGPPGVGKTSIGKSIARALNRKYFRFSVGGLSDVAEIKGHRRTYLGAMPGKVIQALKKVQTENPLIMIDEIDKLSRGHQGDPASALLELLDPEQNNAFLDHYMDVPVDLSKVLFVCTANTIESIPAPLLDRMEIINVSGYVAEEKVAIAKNYLVPAALKAAGLKDSTVDLNPESIVQLIKFYCRESGVRNLKKQIDKIFRKAAFKIVQQDSIKDESVQENNPRLTINLENLKDFVGSPVFTSDRMYEKTPTGVVMGLAWTSMGGSALYVESVQESAISKESKPHFHYTGQMGDVMKESAMIAYTYSKAYIAKNQPSNQFFNKASIHLHVPEGATPKDGPSAGVTMTTALLSLALNRPVPENIAMTGELTLTGKVLRIGGVKEKTIAAKRSGVTRIIFPHSNKSDWDELEDFIKEGLEPHFVEWYDEISQIVFPIKN